LPISEINVCVQTTYAILSNIPKGLSASEKIPIRPINASIGIGIFLWEVTLLGCNQIDDLSFTLLSHRFIPVGK
jgi:hypothetical protein